MGCAVVRRFFVASPSKSRATATPEQHLLGPSPPTAWRPVGPRRHACRLRVQGLLGRREDRAIRLAFTYVEVVYTALPCLRDTGEVCNAGRSRTGHSNVERCWRGSCRHDVLLLRTRYRCSAINRCAPCSDVDTALIGKSKSTAVLTAALPSR